MRDYFSIISMRKSIFAIVLSMSFNCAFSQISFIEKKEIKEEQKELVLEYDSLLDINQASRESKSVLYYGQLVGQDIIYIGDIHKYNWEYIRFFWKLKTKGKGKRAQTIELGTDIPKIGSEFTIIDYSRERYRITLQDKLTGEKYTYAPGIGYGAKEWIVKGYYEKLKQLYVGKIFYDISSQLSAHMFNMDTDEGLDNMKDFPVWECIDVSIQTAEKKSYTGFTASRVVLVFKNKEGDQCYSYLEDEERNPIRLSFHYTRSGFNSKDVFTEGFQKNIEQQIIYAGINEREILAGRYLNEEQYQKLSNSLKEVEKMKKEMAAADAKAKEEEERIRKEWAAEMAAKDAKAKADAKRRASEKATERKKKLIEKYGESIANDILKSYVRIGWTKEMCRESWGAPKDINRTIGSYGVHEQWVYGGGNYLYFENGILTTIQD